LPSHLASIVPLIRKPAQPFALLDGRHHRVADGCGVRLVVAAAARKTAASLAIIGSGVQARSHLERWRASTGSVR
jgi:hypothetical protein